MSHQGITAGAHMDGVYHDSHALEGGGIVGNGILMRWWPDTYNRKILIETRQDEQLWDMDGGGFDRIVFAGLLPVQGAIVTANTPNERFIIKPNGVTTSSWIYDYDGNLLYTNNPSGTATNESPGTRIDKRPYARSDGLTFCTQKTVTEIAPVIYLGTLRRAFHHVYKHYTLSDDNVYTELVTWLDAVYITSSSTATGSIKTKDSSGFTGITANIGTEYYDVAGYAEVTNYIQTNGGLKIIDQDGNDSYSGASLFISAVADLFAYYSDHALLLQSNAVKKLAYGGASGDASTIATGISGIGIIPIAGTDHNKILMQNQAQTEWVIISNSNASIPLGIYPARSNSDTPRYFVSGGYMYYDHKQGGNDFISRININTLAVEDLVELVP